MECSYPSEPVSVVCFPQWHNADSIKKKSTEYLQPYGTVFRTHCIADKMKKWGDSPCFPNFLNYHLKRALTFTKGFCRTLVLKHYPFMCVDVMASEGE